MAAPEWLRRTLWAHRPVYRPRMELLSQAGDPGAVNQTRRTSLVGAALAALAASVGIVVAGNVNTEPAFRDIRLQVAVVATAACVGWLMAPLPRERGVFSIVRGGLLAAMAFAVPGAAIVVALAVADGVLAEAANTIALLTGPLILLVWSWVVVLTFTFPFALIWALVARVVPISPGDLTARQIDH